MLGLFGAQGGHLYAENVILRTENTAVLNVDDDLALGELFNLRLKISRNLSYDGILRVNLRVNENFEPPGTCFT